MQFIDLKSQYERIKTNVQNGINAVLEHGRYVGGPEITDLEEKLANMAGRKHALACSSGTDALLIPLSSIGIRRGDAVFCPSFTFVATAEVVSILGATPIFIDINPDTFNLDTVHLEQSIKFVLEKTDLIPKLIIPVDLFGLPADYDKINEIAKKYNLKIIEDAAQGFGATYKGKPAGSFGDAAATSFYPAKPLGAYGDAGAAFTDSDQMIEVFRSIRVHGMGGERYDNIRIGLNGRMSSIQAAILLAKLEIFEEEVGLRNVVAARYENLLADKIKTPIVPDNLKSVWAQYTVLAESEDHKNSVMAKAKEAEIPIAVFYPKPCHLQTAYKYRGKWLGNLKVSEEYSKRVFSLPMHPYLTEEDQNKIAKIFA